MANYETLKAAIQSVVKTNGNNEITGALLQQSLLAMINSLGSGYQFVDVATTATKPGTPDQKVFYIANGKGTYTNFGGISITEDEVVILYYDTDWHKVSTGIASQAKLSELNSKISLPSAYHSAKALLYKEQYTINSAGVPISTASYNVYKIDPADSIKIKLVGKTYTAGHFVVCFYSSEMNEELVSDNFIKGVYPNPATNPTTIDQEIAIPEGTKTIALVKYIYIGNIPASLQIVPYLYKEGLSVKDILAKASFPISYRVNNDTIEIVSKYGSHTDRKVTLKKFGVNNLFDFYEFANLENESRMPSLDFDNFISKLSITTDMHSPFQIKAISNIDGDNISGGEYRLYFTGGQHGYNNTGSSTTATARTTKVRFIANGNEVSEGIGYANKIEIRWTNRVQGCNTTKADGTGREVLEESHILSFDGNVWNEMVDLMPLEAIRLVTYYAFELQYSAIFDKTIKYIGATSRGEFTLPIASNCASTNCESFVCSGVRESARVFVDESLDLGKRETKVPYGAFSETYNKAYMCLVKSGYELDMAAGSHYYVRGGYQFIPEVE